MNSQTTHAWSNFTGLIYKNLIIGQLIDRARYKDNQFAFLTIASVLLVTGAVQQLSLSKNSPRLFDARQWLVWRLAVTLRKATSLATAASDSLLCLLQNPSKIHYCQPQIGRVSALPTKKTQQKMSEDPPTLLPLHDPASSKPPIATMLEDILKDIPCGDEAGFPESGFFTRQDPLKPAISLPTPAAVREEGARQNGHRAK